MSWSVSTIEIEQLPSSLAEIPRPPKQLFIAGRKPNPHSIFLCIIGSRKPSSYGEKACKTIIAGLTGFPITIVSGLALGIDSLALECAIASGLSVIAMPGSGLSSETLYPSSNLPLAKKIIVYDGCLLSEFEPEFRATTWSFPKRNRLMAGIAQATVIIEAAPKSGSLITAKLAVEYNRMVFAVPGSIFSSLSTGPHQLIKEGAVPVTSAQDILIELGLIKPDADHSTIQIDSSTLSPREANIVSFLQQDIPIGEMSERLGISVHHIQIIISELELRGVI